MTATCPEGCSEARSLERECGGWERALGVWSVLPRVEALAARRSLEGLGLGRARPRPWPENDFRGGPRKGPFKQSGASVGAGSRQSSVGEPSRV